MDRGMLPERFHEKSRAGARMAENEKSRSCPLSLLDFETV